MSATALTLRDKQPLSADWNTYFEDTANLRYRTMNIKQGLSFQTYLLTEQNEIAPIHEIPQFFTMKKPTEIEAIPDTEFFKINGHSLRINAKYQKARFVRGYWLEFAVQLTLRKAEIDFIGNSTNLNHYPHSLGLYVDIQTEHLLIECTNLTKWLNFDGMQEKINYFHKADPNHAKKWILITTSSTCIPKQIRQQIANYDITLLLTNQVVNSRNFRQVANQLYQPLTELNQQEVNHHMNELINNSKNKLTNNYKNRYQTIPVNGELLKNGMCGYFERENDSGLAG